MSSEMPLLTAAMRFNVSAPSFPSEMCESVPVTEALRCGIPTVNGKGKHKCSQQGLISCCVTMKNCSAFLKAGRQNCAGSKVLTTTSYVPKCVFEIHFSHAAQEGLKIWYTPPRIALRKDMYEKVL